MAKRRNRGKLSAMIKTNSTQNVSEVSSSKEEQEKLSATPAVAEVVAAVTAPEIPTEEAPSTTTVAATPEATVLKKATEKINVRATFIVDQTKLEKLRAISYWDREEQKDILDEILGKYIARYENKNGEIQPVPPKKKK